MIKSDLTSRKRFEDVSLVIFSSMLDISNITFSFKMHWNNNINFVVIDKDTCI